LIESDEIKQTPFIKISTTTTTTTTTTTISSSSSFLFRVFCLHQLESLLAYAYQNTKRNEEAVSLYEKSVPILKKHLKDEKQIAALLMNMAEAYAAVKNITEAEKMARY
jgi:tetratricopeptide (TPR) repeat protein